MSQFVHVILIALLLAGCVEEETGSDKKSALVLEVEGTLATLKVVERLSGQSAIPANKEGAQKSTIALKAGAPYRLEVELADANGSLACGLFPAEGVFDPKQSVSLVCSENSWRVMGTVEGLPETKSITLINHTGQEVEFAAGSEPIALFVAFPTQEEGQEQGYLMRDFAFEPEPEGLGFAVALKDVPEGFVCGVTNGLGRLMADYPDVSVVCEEVAEAAIKERTPQPDEVGVELNTSVSITFKNPFDADTVSSSRFFLKNGSGHTVPTQLTFPNASTIKLAPIEPLAFGTTYSVHITEGVLDNEGAPMIPGGYRWAFTTRPPANDSTHPTFGGGITLSDKTIRSFKASWPAAMDNQTPQDQLWYRVRWGYTERDCKWTSNYQLVCDEKTHTNQSDWMQGVLELEPSGNRTPGAPYWVEVYARDLSGNTAKLGPVSVNLPKIAQNGPYNNTVTISAFANNHGKAANKTWAGCSVRQGVTKMGNCNGFSGAEPLTFQYCHERSNACNYDSGLVAPYGFPSGFDNLNDKALKSVHQGCRDLSNMHFGGFTNWRVPTASELRDFAQKAYKDNSDWFDIYTGKNQKGNTAEYWSASSDWDGNSAKDAKTVNIKDAQMIGGRHKTDGYHYLLCVTDSLHPTKLDN